MLFDPNGNVVDQPSLPNNGKRVIPFDDPQYAVCARDAEWLFKVMHLTVICRHCGGTPEMGNHPLDASWKMECACSVRTLVPVDDRGRPTRRRGVN